MLVPLSVGRENETVKAVNANYRLSFIPKKKRESAQKKINIHSYPTYWGFCISQREIAHITADVFCRCHETAKTLSQSSMLHYPPPKNNITNN